MICLVAARTQRTLPVRGCETQRRLHKQTSFMPSSVENSRRTSPRASSLQVQTTTALVSDLEAQPDSAVTATSADSLEDYKNHEEKAKAHEQKVQNLQRVFDENMQNKPVIYRRVCVLLLSWENTVDDLKVEEEV